MPLNYRAILTQTLEDKYDAGEVGNIVKYYFIDRFGLIDGSQIQLSQSQQKIFKSDLGRFLLFEPYHYIVEKGYFYNRPFLVNNHTLIPRPETEELVHHCLQIIRNHTVVSLNVLEVGTGSGCIALTLLLESKVNLSIKAIDISKEALEVANVNAESFRLNLEFVCMDFLDESEWHKLQNPDIIVSNPPYISVDEMISMNDNVLNYEPHIALFSNDHLLFYKKIAKFASQLVNKPMVFCEINPLFAEETSQVFKEFGFTNVSILDDLQTRPRILIAQ